MKLTKFGRVSAIRQQRRQERYRSLWWFIFVGTAISIIVVVRAFLFQTFKIPSGSMVPTLLIGDHIVVNRFLYGIHLPGAQGKILRFRRPSRGDVVVFARFSEFEDQDSDTHYIKRIVAVPGDVVEVKDYRAYINGSPVGKNDTQTVPDFHPGLADQGARIYGPVTLADGQYFVLGDNLSNSRDGRYYGPISEDDIEGRAEFVYWSWDVQGTSASVRWDRVGKAIE